MSEPLVEPHVRYCHGCGKFDDAPRAQVQARQPDGSITLELRHKQAECMGEFYELMHPETQRLVESGLKDDELRDAIDAANQAGLMHDLGLDPTHPNYIGDDAAGAIAVPQNEVTA